jgi:hypothetical protein
MTPIKSIRYAAIAILFPLAGCSHRVPQATIEVIDTSRSITPRAEKAALDAIEVQIGQMQRGDLLVLIPITGDAANDSGGRILRLSAPTLRETYDADLRRFREQAGKQFAAWVAALDKHQSRTDILGALDAARQELAALTRESDRRLIVVTDFLEDDGTTTSCLTRRWRARRAPATSHHGFASNMNSPFTAYLSALAGSKVAISSHSRHTAEKRSKRFGQHTLRQRANEPRSNSTARAF